MEQSYSCLQQHTWYICMQPDFCGLYRILTHSISLPGGDQPRKSSSTHRTIIFMGLILRCHLWCFTKILIQTVISATAHEIDWKWQIRFFLAPSHSTNCRRKRVDIVELLLFSKRLNGCQWFLARVMPLSPRLRTGGGNSTGTSGNVHLNPLEREWYFNISTIFRFTSSFLTSLTLLAHPWCFFLFALPGETDKKQLNHHRKLSLLIFIYFPVIYYCCNRSVFGVFNTQTHTLTQTRNILR